MMSDSVWAVQNDQNWDIFVTNETLLWAETRRRKELDGGTLVPHTGSEEAFTFCYLPIVRSELCTFKNYDTLRGDDIRLM